MRDPEEPDARVQILLRGREDGGDTTLIAALALIVAAYYCGPRRPTS